MTTTPLVALLSLENSNIYSLEDGPARGAWKSLGVPVTIIQTCDQPDTAVDWLNYDGILVSSLEARGIFSCFVQEPFKSLPLIWTIHEEALATRSRKYSSNSQTELLNDWIRVFNRSTVVVFPNYFLPMIYSTFDAGNFFVIPGSPTEVCKVESIVALDKDHLQGTAGNEAEDIVITIVGSQFLYRGLWLEHSIVLRALLPLLEDFLLDADSPRLKVIILSGDSTSNYSSAVEAIAYNLKYPSGIVKHVAIDVDADNVLSTSDLVIYGSFREEQSFPDILIKAMCLGKPIVAPDLSMISRYVDDRVNGYLFLKENIRVLSEIVLQVISNGKLSPLSRNIASLGQRTAQSLKVLETIEGYAALLENVLKFSSEVLQPKAVGEINPKWKEKWQWNLFDAVSNSSYMDRNLRSHTFLDVFEELYNHTEQQKQNAITEEKSFIYSIWEEEKSAEMVNLKRRKEEEMLKDRTDQYHGTWEEVYRNAKKADRSRNDLHERDEGEIERTGQPLCIYEPYFGMGTWPFLHLTSLYRGIGLSTRGRRPRTDDIDAPSRLPLLHNPYYRDLLGEYGAFFSIANRIDRIHKNAWIGFQSWRTTARKASLSGIAEKALLNAIQTRRHGDTLYFWVRMDNDSRNPLKQDFWSFCDAINAGNCKFAVSEALKRMYGLKYDLKSLPPMPVDGDTWSVMHSWALPTRSFLEFVMFSRMFLDALDAEMYIEHHSSGHCYLSLSKDKHCYSQLLELLVNVWAYHSARRMVYVNPQTGEMQEQHKFKGRRGYMWVKWFSLSMLKSMDEELAEEYDVEHPTRRWLWPSTGEVFWQGMYEKERHLRNKQKERRKQKSKEKIERIKKRTHQKAIGKFVKPPPEAADHSNTTMVTSIQ
ncbi:uncharacterized protein LOC126803930 isoform X2 [Argentina anserina]|uniref:uncharacterized protein LOC126803930 isoform X2 n=1 Tax=Argentina anserina TaxID=57926 RepID=UPI0021767EC4|nr:uncharacterized protein LOC126803930 isoform X2 [Potentilla anserina]